MRRKNKTNFERYMEIDTLMESLAGCSYHNRIKLILEKCKSKIINLSEFYELIQMTVDDKESGRIKYRNKRPDPVAHQNKIDAVIARYVMHRRDEKRSYNCALNLTAKAFDVSSKTVEKYIRDNRKIVCAFNNNTRQEFENQYREEVKRLGLDNCNFVDKSNSMNISNMVKFINELPGPLNGSHLVAKAITEVFNPNHPKTKENY